jgi:hypothetical protein
MNILLHLRRLLELVAVLWHGLFQISRGASGRL